MEEDTNIIEEILSTAALSYEDRIRFKEIGRPTPQIIVSQKGQSRAETYNRNFNVSSYDKYPWLAGYKDSMYCFPCLLFCINVGVANPWLTGFQTIFDWRKSLLYIVVQRSTLRTVSRIRALVRYAFRGAWALPMTKALEITIIWLKKKDNSPPDNKMVYLLWKIRIGSARRWWVNPIRK